MRKLTLLVLLLLLVAVPVSAQDELPSFIERTACNADLSGQTFQLYHFGDISAAYAPITQPLLAGIGDALAYFNARGGLCGATIEAVNQDTAGDLDRTQAVYDDFSTRSPKPLMMVLYASPDAELLRDQVAEDEIPVLISAGSVEGLYGETGVDGGWIYATNPLYVNQLGSFCDFVAANPDQFPAEPTIGYISWPGAFGQAAFTIEGVRYCESKGVSFIHEVGADGALTGAEIFLPTAQDVITNVQNLVDKGANILYTNTLASGPPIIKRALIELGYDQDVVLAGVNWIMDSSAGLIDQQTRGADGLPSVNGMYGSLPFLWWTETGQESIAWLNEQFAIAAEANGRDAVTQLRLRNIAYLLGWTVVDLYIELGVRAVNEVGAENLNGAAIKAQLDTLTYNSLGLLPIDFKNGELRDTRANRIARYAFLNATGDGPATSAEDAFIVEGAGIFLPILIPLTEFSEAPDLRPGVFSVE